MSSELLSKIWNLLDTALNTYLDKVRTHIKSLLEPGVMDARRSKAKRHLCCERCCISTEVVDEIIRVLQDTEKHGLVLQVLIWYICSCSIDVQDQVEELPNHLPHPGG